MADSDIIPIQAQVIVKTPDVSSLVSQVRPAWQAKNLIARVKKLIPVDPSSACQRIFNAAIHDLREKIIVAGIDIAKEAAASYKLPPIINSEDIENYSTHHIIQLVYRMGLLTRPEWRRFSRCYEIRRDLEHEDNEYEAGPEDCIYVFKTCVEVVLSKDPIQALRVSDVKELINQPSPAYPAESLQADYKSAPQPRQEKICLVLISIALDKEQSEIVQQNAFNFLGQFEPLTHKGVILKLVEFFQGRIGRGTLDMRHARVAHAAGVFPYLKRAHKEDFFNIILGTMNEVGSSWGAHEKHGDLLRSFAEVGGLLGCPPSTRKDILYWLTKTYLGTPGGRTSYGNIRHVFFSNTAAPLIKSIIKDAKELVTEDLRAVGKRKHIKALISNQHIARRYNDLLDLT